VIDIEFPTSLPEELGAMRRSPSGEADESARD
jgi:hypothetical protein